MKIGSFYPVLHLNSVYGIIKAGILLDTATGRFLSPDSVDYLGANGDLNSYNLYAYFSNNPVMYVDPMGKWTFSINLTFFIGFGGGYSFSIGLSADSNKDLAIQYSYSAPNSDNTRNTVIGATVGGGVAVQYTWRQIFVPE